jgi:hypothetical protein
MKAPEAMGEGVRDPMAAGRIGSMGKAKRRRPFRMNSGFPLRGSAKRICPSASGREPVDENFIEF